MIRRRPSALRAAHGPQRVRLDSRTRGRCPRAATSPLPRFPRPPRHLAGRALPSCPDRRTPVDFHPSTGRPMSESEAALKAKRILEAAYRPEPTPAC